MKLKTYKEYFFYWSLAMVFITLPMPKYNLNSMAIIALVVSWMFVNSFQDKWQRFQKNKLNILSLSLIFLIGLIGMIYTENTTEGIKEVKNKLPFLVFPLIFGTTQAITIAKKNTLIKYFSFAVLLMGVFALLKAIYIYNMGLGNYFVYDDLGRILNKHTTYYSLFCIISVAYFIYDISEIRKTPVVISVISISILLSLIYLLSARIAIVALMVLAIYFIKTKITKRRNKTFLLFLIISTLMATLLFSSNYVARFKSLSADPDKIADVNEFNTRILHWKSAIQTLKSSEYIYGKGTGDGKENLYETYLRNDFRVGFDRKYNAHNQYIEFFLSHGILGIIAYFILLLLVFIYALRFNDTLGILFIILFVMYSLTESILERQSGVIIVSLVCSLIYYSNRQLLLQNKLNEN